MEQATELESVLRRVHKLLAIAGDERANPAEAAAAASQAEKIMRKYQIEHADVVSASMSRDDSFDSQEVGGTMNPSARGGSTTMWAAMLSLAIGRLNDCKSGWARSADLGVCVRYSGYKSDTQVALWTHLYLVSQMVSALRRYQKDHGSSRQESERFRKGFVVAVVGSINQAIEDKKSEMALAASSRELVVIKAQAVAERFGRQVTRAAKFQAKGDGFKSGYTEGQKVDISRRGLASEAFAPVLLG